jgi:hypothetical protein
MCEKHSNSLYFCHNVTDLIHVVLVPVPFQSLNHCCGVPPNDVDPAPQLGFKQTSTSTAYRYFFFNNDLL